MQKLFSGGFQRALAHWAWVWPVLMMRNEPHHPSSICSWDLPHKLAERKAGWIGSSHPKCNLRGVKLGLPTKFNCDIKGSFISNYMGLKDQRGILQTKFNTAKIFIIIGSITPKTPDRDNRYCGDGYQLYLLYWFLRYRLCECSHKKGTFQGSRDTFLAQSDPYECRRLQRCYRMTIVIKW